MKFNIIVKTFLCTLIASVILCGCDHATDSAISGQTKTPDQIKVELPKSLPGLTKVDSVSQSPIAGLYEVVVGRKVFYVTSNGKYFIFGNIVDPVSKKSLTEVRTQELSKIRWKDLPLDLAIKEVNGTGKRKLAVFSDPDCPYCQMFEKQVAAQLADTTIYTFLFPLPMHPNAKTDAIKIWCSKDRTKAWTDWMRNKVALPTNSGCDTSDLDKIYKIGTDVVIVEGTPTIILENGQILPGMLPVDQLEAQMDKVSGIPVKNASVAL